MMGQLDYIYLIYGLEFILLATVCFAFGKHNRHSLPWTWLGLFGLFGGITEFFYLVCFTIGRATAIDVFTVLTLAATFFSLTQFASMGHALLFARKARHWMGLALLLVPCLAYMHGWAGLCTALRYSLGLFGGVWAGSVLIIASRRAEAGAPRRGLFVAGSALILYSLSIGLVVPEASALPCLITNSVFAAKFGLPIQLARGLALVLIAGGVWRALGMFERPARRMCVRVVAVTALALLAGGWIFVRMTESSVHRQTVDHIFTECRLGAASIDPAMVEGLGNVNDVSDKRYQLLRLRLAEMRRRNPQLRWVYLMTLKHGHIYFTADSEPASSPDYSPPGDEYFDAPYGLRQLCKGKVTTASCEYKDRWGRWLSAFVPIYSDSTGEIIAVMGMDRELGPMQLALRRSHLQPMAITILALILLFSFSIAYLRQRESLELIVVSEQAARESEKRYRALFNSMSEGFALHEMIFDEQGNPWDCLCLEVNYAYEELIERKSEEIIGKTLREVLPTMDQETIDLFGRVAQSGEPARFDKHFPEVDRCFSIVAFCPEPGQFAVLASDITDKKEMYETLLEEKRLSETIGSSLPGVFCMIDSQARAIWWNKQYEKLIAVDQCGGGHTPLTAVYEEDRPFVLSKMKQVFEEGHVAAELRLWHTDGTLHYGYCSAVRVDLGGEPHALVFGLDITERKQAETQVRLHSAALNAANDLIAIVDPNGTVVSANEALERQTGYSLDEVVGQHLSLLWPQDLNGRYLERIWAAVGAGHAWTGEMLCMGRDGSTYTADVSITPLPREDGEITHLVAIARNISDKKAYEDLLDYQAHHDALTGLPNRLAFSDELADMVTDRRRRGEHCAILFVDLDRFKLVNDTMGHQAGDALLIEVAARLGSCLRDEDVLARMGGDEFTVLLRHIQSPEQAGTVAYRMLEQVGLPFEIGDSRLVIGASIGISLYPENAQNVVGLLKSADAAMYRAKELGRNNCQFYSEELSQISLARVEMEHDLRQALKREEFKVYYQPLMDAKTLRIIGAEALLRWDHPEKGMISPGLFIPVAEETGMILQMGKMVLETACKQCKNWQDLGFEHLEIAVNVSPTQLRNSQFVDQVVAAIADAGLRSTSLKLEITETALAKNEYDEVNILSMLKDMGVCICLDDFGIGYSSLSRLKELPIAHMKVDGSFIKDIDRSSKDKAMTASIIAMAHNLGIRVTAEWIEDEEQLRTIQTMDCDDVQGYLVSPALPADSFETFLRSWPERQGSICKAA